MQYTIKITQTREGYVQIEAENARDALTKAEDLYNGQGHVLPDLEDVGPLQIRVDAGPQQARTTAMATGPLTEEEVVTYLKRQGHPQPEIDGTLDEFMAGGSRPAHYIEAVRNGYDLPDIDRWFHLEDILNTELSFRAAMFIDNGIWEEGHDVLDVRNAQDILDSPEELIKKRLAFLADQHNYTGSFDVNTLADSQDIGELILIDGKPWGLTPEDVADLIKALNFDNEIEIFIPSEESPSMDYDEADLPPEARVYICTGQLKEFLFEGPYRTCLDFCKDENWTFKDGNDFVWSLELEDIRPKEQQHSEPAQKAIAAQNNNFEALASQLETAAIIEYKGIRFDEWVVDQENQSIWAEMCEHCAKKYYEQISEDLSEGGVGACSVSGCDVVGMDADTEHHYYVDMKPELIRVVETLALTAPSTPALSESDGRKPSLAAQIQSADARKAAPETVPEHRPLEK